MGTFAAVGVSAALVVPPGFTWRFALSGTWVQVITVERLVGNVYKEVMRFGGNVDIILPIDPNGQQQTYRAHCLARTSGTSTYTMALSTVPQSIPPVLDRNSVEQFGVDENGLRGVTLTLSALLNLTGIEDTLTAHAGGTQAAALALSATKSIHRVSVCATNADSVKLPAAVLGQVHWVINSGAASLQVFGSGTDTIDDVATATGVAIATLKSAMFVCVSAGKWYRNQGA